ncbi:MAG: AmmeMemoRadiSam system radical SAM enzyme [FCB group bacterium]|nr:AmmeMemoRadiSam system radical SAM enzyme [FCB group bacterium]
MRDALYFERLEEEVVICHLCPAECRLKPGRRGICRSRHNDSGSLKTDNFGETVTIAIDPIEKKPLYHFHPTANIVSVGPNGCNFSCRHCQNWDISQNKVPTRYIAPEQLPEIASEQGSIGIAYTYTEPLIWYEYILEAAPQIKNAGLLNVLVSNGYINPEPLTDLLPLIDAWNIDLKGMRPEFYRRVCKARLEPVMEVIRMVAASPAHLELTNLVIPGYNDSDEDFHRLGEFIASVDPAVPLHLSAYHPSYKMDAPRTPPETLLRAYNILKEYLVHLFVGNMEIPGCSNSNCPACGEILIERSGYRVRVIGLDDNAHCRNCGKDSAIICRV